MKFRNLRLALFRAYDNVWRISLRFGSRATCLIHFVFSGRHTASYGRVLAEHDMSATSLLFLLLVAYVVTLGSLILHLYLGSDHSITLAEQVVVWHGAYWII